MVPRLGISSQPGYAKAHLDVPLSTLSLVDDVLDRSTTGLGVEHGLQVYFPRKKSDGIHMNTHVGIVSLCDDAGRSTFEFGVTDLQRMSSGKKKRKLGVT